MSDTLAPVTAIPTRHMEVHSRTFVCGPTILECDICDLPGPMVHIGEGDDPRDIAAAEGWQVDVDADRDICPACIRRGHTLTP